MILLQLLHKKRAILPRFLAEAILPPSAHLIEAEAVKVPPRVVVAPLVVVLF